MVRGHRVSLISYPGQLIILESLIHDDPDNSIKEEPWLWQSFALHPASLAGRWQILQEKAAKLDLKWVGRKAVAISVEDAEGDNRQKTTYKWEPLPASGNFQMITAALRESLMVVLPTQLATYHDKLGFVLLDGSLEVESTGYQSTPVKKGEKPPRGFVLKQRSYKEHIQGLVDAYNRNISKNMRYVMQRLEQQLELPEKSIDQAIRLAIACHDIGKLGEQWQQWAWEWQKVLFETKRYPALPPQFHFFAKTDFNSHSDEHQELRKHMKTKRPPHHACESVALGMELLEESIYASVGKKKGELLIRAIFGAIAHHHTTDAHTYNSIRLKQGASIALEEALEVARQQEIWPYHLASLNLSKIEGGDLAPSNLSLSDTPITKPRRGRMHELETWLYFVIVRALRLSDQRADKYE